MPRNAFNELNSIRIAADRVLLLFSPLTARVTLIRFALLRDFNQDQIHLYPRK